MLENKWGLRFVALILALFLFLSVNDVFALFGDNQFNQNDQMIIEDVPVKVIYDDKNLYLTGAPKTVNVKVSGPQSIVKKTESMRDFTVTLDLSNSKVGEYKKKFNVKGISDKLNYEVIPKFANITLSEKIKDTRQVEAEISNSRIATGYELVGKEVDPSQVTIIGGEEEISKIAYVKATLKDTTKLSKTTAEEAEVNVFDSNLNKLDVSVKPATVKVNIKVAPTSKTVAISPKKSGQLPSDLKLNSLEISEEEVELFGKRSVLDGIGSLAIEVDLSKVTKDTVVKENIPLPKDVSSANPKQVEIKIDVSKK
ncbi:YbbR-like domain-containing protein [Macrococcus equi]|uniref:CdaR family protein n=1 Tax=Macrococcus equi TaxID=3395462 RepID=UPI0039BE1AAA